MRTDELRIIRLSEYQPPAYRIPQISMIVQFGDEQTRVITVLEVEKNSTQSADQALVLDGDELRLVSLKLNGVALSPDAYRTSPRELTIHHPPADRFTLEIETQLDPDNNTKLMGLYRSNGVFCTQCEAQGFRRITYFLDRPDVLSTYTVRLEASQTGAPVLLSNGNLIDTGKLDGDRHFAKWHDPHPKPSYLFAMVAGDLACIQDDFTTQSGRKVKLGIYVEHGKENRADYAMDALKRSMIWDERQFGCQYDLDVFNIVAVSDFNMGAMENKGLNIFNDKFILADADTATDADYANIESVVAHEYFHNWTGNRITCRDWFQLCLKEGLTVYRDQEFSADERARSVERISDVSKLKAHQFPEDAGPLAHPVRPELYREINNFYTATVYEKGAELVRMLATLLGPDDFKSGIDHYFSQYDGTAATVEDFIGAFETATRTDLTSFFNWYRQAGTPTLIVEENYNSERQQLKLTFTQSTAATPGQPNKLPVPIPVRFGMIGADGRELKCSEIEGGSISADVLLVDQIDQSFTLKGVTEKPVVSLLRGFSAPVKLRQELASSDRVHLLRYDTDPFNRWQAVQDLSFELISKLLSSGSYSDRVLEADEGFVSALVDVVQDEALDPAFRAHLLRLPSETEIARLVGENVDPSAIHKAALTLKAQIGKQGHGVLREIYDTMSAPRTYSPDASSAGQRAFRLQALSLITSGNGELGEMLAAEHYNSANNMTDRIGALGILVHNRLQGSRAALDNFAERYGEDALTMDKWLSVQASAPFADTLDRVQDLTAHTVFSWSTPNRVRALIAAFATLNPVAFNREDGAGFVFLASAVEKIDKSNPQLAARLLTAFRSWKALEPNRQSKAKSVLISLQDTGSLSVDTSDILDRTLNA